VDVVAHDRPALREVLGILAVCALLLVGLARLDNEAAREYNARAQKALAEQRAAGAPQPAAPERPARAASAGPRTPSAPGSPADVLLAIMAGGGLATAAAGAVLLSRRSA
jgi:hypothetical protein